MIVAEYKIGNSTVKIDDTYCKDKTKEQIEAILQRVSDIVTRALQARQK